MTVFEETEAFYESYRGVKRTIGRSADGRPLRALFIGSPAGAVAISQYAIHGREWVTALLALEHVRRGLRRGGAWIVPLADPDGALLSEVGLSGVSAERRAFLSRVNGGDDFSLWKANAEGVDLNVNFDARWGTGVQNVFAPAPENYVGDRPFSAPETQALRDFTRAVSPQVTVSWHTKGGEIYWEFHQPPLRARRDKRLAALLSESTGYPLRKISGSAGGYKDWCIQALRIPAFTVEAGRADAPHPLGREELGDLLLHGLDALADLMDGLEDG